MAVTKLWPVRYNLARVIGYAADASKTSAQPRYSRGQYQALADVLAYAEDEEKTERELYVTGINCDAPYARDEFINTKLLYGKTDGIQAYHGYISFKEQDISPELAHKVGVEFARRVWGDRFQIIVTTHLNTKHLHCHFVINSVSFLDGKMLHGDEKVWFKFRHIADEICREYGLFVKTVPDYAKQSSYYYHKERDGVPTRYSMVRQQIDGVIEKSRGLSEFKYYLEQMGYRYQLSPNRKYWTVIPKGYEKPIRLYKLGEAYTNEAIIQRLQENYRKIILEPFQDAHTVSRRYVPDKTEALKRKAGGLYGLYLHYCYVLGYFSKNKKQHLAQLHFAFREDWAKLNTIAAQTNLLCRENISTTEELMTFRAKVEDEINTLIADRTPLQKKIRRKINYDELYEAKDKISTINERLRTLRRELKLCDGIAERSEQIRSNLKLAGRYEELTDMKEVRSDEQRR